MVIICISLMINDVEYHFLCLFDICISFMMKCLFRYFTCILIIRFFVLLCVVVFNDLIYLFFWLCWVLLLLGVSLVAEPGLLSRCDHGLLVTMASLAVEQWALGHLGFSSCSMRAHAVRGGP